MYWFVTHLVTTNEILPRVEVFAWFLHIYLSVICYLHPSQVVVSASDKKIEEDRIKCRDVRI